MLQTLMECAMFLWDGCWCSSADLRERGGWERQEQVVAENLPLCVIQGEEEIEAAKKNGSLLAQLEM